MKFSGTIGNGPVNKLLHFGGDTCLDSSSRTDSRDGGADIVTLVRHALAVVCTVPVVLVVNIVVDFGEFDLCLWSVADTCRSTCTHVVQMLSLISTRFSCNSCVSVSVRIHACPRGCARVVWTAVYCCKRTVRAFSDLTLLYVCSMYVCRSIYVHAAAYSLNCHGGAMIYRVLYKTFQSLVECRTESVTSMNHGLSVALSSI